MSSTRALGITAPSESATVPRTVAAPASSANELNRSSRQKKFLRVWSCLKYVIVPLGNWLRQNRSPDSRFGELSCLPRDFVPSGCKPSACPVLNVYSYGVVAESSPRFPNILPFGFCRESQIASDHGSRMKLFR